MADGSEGAWCRITRDGQTPPFDDEVVRDADAYALHAALSRFGYEADAPTLKGDDADGDGVTGEG